MVVHVELVPNGFCMFAGHVRDLDSDHRVRPSRPRTVYCSRTSLPYFPTKSVCPQASMKTSFCMQIATLTSAQISRSQAFRHHVPRAVSIRYECKELIKGPLLTRPGPHLSAPSRQPSSRERILRASHLDCTVLVSRLTVTLTSGPHFSAVSRQYHYIQHPASTPWATLCRVTPTPSEGATPSHGYRSIR